jgi:glycosyltransferase involved in cell wall biosynthesis
MSRVVLGMPMYNGGARLPEALDSLLSQTYEDFGLVVADDRSFDAAPEILQRYAARDPRISYVRNERRLGGVYNWRRVLELAREHHPDMEYFAFVSDHDTWHRRWLERLVPELDADPGVVAVYGNAVGMDDEHRITHRPGPFDTARTAEPWRRFRDTWWLAPVGYMIYALFRADALEECGGYRPVRDPDRLLLLELSLRGRFKQVDEVLYYRWRPPGKSTQERQRAAFYPDGLPLRAFLPWPILYARELSSTYVLPRNPVPGVSRVTGARAAEFAIHAGAQRELHRFAFGNRNRWPALRLVMAVTSRQMTSEREPLAGALRKRLRQTRRGLGHAKRAPDSKTRR